MTHATSRAAKLEWAASRAPALAALAVAVAFLPSLGAGFVFDDVVLVVENPFAHGAEHVARCFTTDLWDTPARPDRTASTLFYRPLVCASYAVNWAVGGGRAWAFHAVNVALHAVAAALATALGRRWTGSSILGLLAALLFAVHPTRTENVIWVSGRTDLLMAVLLLAGHELAVRAAANARAAPIHWAAAAVCWSGAILSKEFALCFVLFLGVEAWRVREQPEVARRLWVGGGVGLIAGAVYLAVRASVFPIRPPEIEAMTLPPPLRVGYALLSVGYYVERVILPWPQTLHYRPVAIIDGAPVLFVPSVILGAVVTLLAVGWVTVAWRRRRPELGALLLAVGLWVPIANVSYTGFPGTTADRFLYLPLLPLGIAVLIAARRPVLKWLESSTLAPLIIVSAVLVASAVDWVRALDYVSDRALWAHELTVNPDNPHALASLAALEAADGNLPEAGALLERARSPASVRYRLLATPGRYYAGLVQLQGARLADGHVAGLEALLAELAALTGSPPRTTRGRSADLDLAAPEDDEHWQVHVANMRPHLLVAAALVASRLGKTADVVRFGGAASRMQGLTDMEHMDLALALDRVEQRERARVELGRVGDPKLARMLAFLRPPEPAGSAAGRSSEQAGAERARSAMVRGAYLLAARELRRAYRLEPSNQPLVEQYVEALTWCRLDHEAALVASRAPDPVAARAAVARAREAWSPRTRSALAPEPGAPW